MARRVPDVNPHAVLFLLEDSLAVNDIENVSISVSKYLEFQETAVNARERNALKIGVCCTLVNVLEHLMASWHARGREVESTCLRNIVSSAISVLHPSGSHA